MSAQQVEEMIQDKGLNAPRILPAQIQALAARVSHTFDVQGTSTFCHAFLDGKFYLATGHSACVSPANFNEGIGRKVAYDNMAVAMNNKLWELEGYRLYREQSDVNY